MIMRSASLKENTVVRKFAWMIYSTFFISVQIASKEKEIWNIVATSFIDGPSLAKMICQ